MKKTRFYTPCLFMLAFAFLPSRNGMAQEDSVKSIRFGNGVKEVHYGIPFLYLKGTDYEAGLQYGHLLQNELKAMYVDFENLMQNLMDREIKHLPWYQRLFANLFGGMVLRHRINAYADRIPADIEDQMRGASEGSGLPLSFFRKIQVMADLYSKRCEGAVIIKGLHTYHCHNLDQPMPLNLLAKYPMVASYDIPGKAKYTNIGFVACLMITTACNEYGISFSENGNNNPRPFDQGKANLYIERNKLITQTDNLKKVDSLIHTVRFPMGLIFTVASSRERQAAVYDLLGKAKAATPVNSVQFVANRTVSGVLGKKSESIYSGDFHDIAREIKFAELIDTTQLNMVDEAIRILSNVDFYHYTGSISVHIESLHNFETDQSVVFDLADSTIYFACHPHFAAWSRWLKYNCISRKVSVYREADPRLFSPDLSVMNKLFEAVESCDWRDSSNVRFLVNAIADSQIDNYFCLSFLSRTVLDYYKNPPEALKYAQKLVNAYPDVITGYFLNGRAYEEQKRHGEAIEQYRLALGCKIQCEYFLAGTCEHLALLNFSLGNQGLAAEYAERALAIHNQYWIPEHLNKRIQELEEIRSKNK